MTNFREISNVFLRNEAAREVADAAAVAEFFKEMIRDAATRNAMGDRARRTVAENRGAAERTARRIVELLP
jgi:3-deoxy-D-manno-octulosonic-acid transferase